GNNDHYCGSGTSIIANPENVGHWYGARLTPPATPFTVTAVQYTLIGGGECDNGLAHQVQVWVEAADAPAAEPPDATIADVAAGESAEGVRVVRVDLEDAIVVDEGESLFVAVEMTGDDVGRLCVGA